MTDTTSMAGTHGVVSPYPGGPNCITSEQIKLRRFYLDSLGLMPEEDLSIMLDVTMQTIKQWRYEGRGPKFTKLGKAVFYRRGDVQAWVDANVRDPATAPDTGGEEPPVGGE